MPCTNVTELLELTLDSEDRVLDYSLTKETCGGKVAGRGLIRDWVKLKSAESVLALLPQEMLEKSDNPDVTTEYLRLKHLFSVQAALATLFGSDSGTEGFITVESVQYALDETRLSARVDLDILTDKIKACGLCGDACLSSS